MIDEKFLDKAGINKSKRNELKEILKELSSKELQDEFWINGKDYPNASGIDEVFHFFFDDTDLSVDSKSEIGRILIDSNEASMISELCLVLDEICDRLGDVDSQSYINDYRWEEVISMSHRLGEYMDCLEK